jgi:CBS domain-containing protein
MTMQPAQRIDLDQELVSVSPATPLWLVTRLMHARNVGTVMIAEEDQLIGVVSDHDIAIALGAQLTYPESPVEQVMRSLLTVGEFEELCTTTGKQ